MKILRIQDFTTTEGSYKQTEVALDTRPGVFFKVVTGTFETPIFSIEQTVVPVTMLHADREQKNVNITVEDNNLIIEQGYRLASNGYLITMANDEWADVSEVKSVNLDATNINAVVLNNGQEVAVTASISDIGVVIMSTGFTPGSSTYYAQKLKTTDNKEYIYPIKLDSHQISSSVYDYDYFSAKLPRIITAFITNN